MLKAALCTSLRAVVDPQRMLDTVWQGEVMTGRQCLACFQQIARGSEHASLRSPFVEDTLVGML